MLKKRMNHFDELKVPAVLLVEDNELLQKVNSYFIEELGYSVEIAKNGNTALNKVVDYQYDLVLLDVGLPDIDGREVCRRIRRIINKKDVPIIVLTAHGYEIEQECLDAGANDFMVKPVSRKELQKLIKHWVNVTDIRR